VRNSASICIRSAHPFRSRAFSCSNDSWTEGGINWGTKPAPGSQQAQTSLSAVGWYEWSLTSYVNTEFGGDKVVTVILAETENKNIVTWLSSKENASGNGPQLVVISQ